MLIRVVERQFRTAVPEELAARIRGATEPRTLEQWLDLVYVSESLEDFQQKMQS